MPQPISPVTAVRRRTAAAEYGPEDFPGCEPFHLPASELDRYEGRLEFWDGRTGTAWKVRDPTSTYHERPSQRLAGLVRELEVLRGSEVVECLGSADLVRLDAAGRKRFLIQADQVLYLHSGCSRGLGAAIDVDTDPLPDVVLEVDHTTDVRRRKLALYRQCGFPEIWVLVPRESPVRVPGLVIHVRRGGGYEEARESAAFPGWKADEIYRALTEQPLPAQARHALERVALAMGAREGTRPEDHPLARSIGRKAQARGRWEGHAEGHAAGRTEGMHAAVTQVLRSRGIPVSASLRRYLAQMGDVTDEALVNAALACRDEADFRRRARETAP